MKRYILFSGDEYYASGGWDDFSATSDSLDELKAMVTYQTFNSYTYMIINGEQSDSPSGQWMHIVDTETMQVVFRDETNNHVPCRTTSLT